MVKRAPPVLRALRDFYLGGQGRAATVRVIAQALDLATPFVLVPVLGPVIEEATDMIWPAAAEAIVVGFEKAQAKAAAKAKRA